MSEIHIQNQTHPLPHPLRVKYCQSFSCRLVGLMFSSQLQQDLGLLLVQGRESRIDSSIHMLFVYMDLAVIWINKDGVVVDRTLARSWRPIYTPQKPARYTLEIHPSRLDQFNQGDKVQFLYA